jgi:hypothetical protein
MLVLDRCKTRQTVLKNHPTCQFSGNCCHSDEACLTSKWSGCGIWAFSITRPTSVEVRLNACRYSEHSHWLVVSMDED